MHHVPLTISRETARDLYHQYLKHKHYSTPIDREVLSVYQKLAAGKLVIKALESVATAGVDEQGLPKLAIARADQKICHLSMSGNGAATMSPGGRRPARRGATTWFDFPAGTFAGKPGWRNAESLVPQAPLHLRPKHALQNYTVLFEADWRKAPPIDPFLLRRIGKADLWLVLAVWDLTEVERAVLAGRL
ncbi:hypothetical protein [Bradyrhizobium elkanii]|uniref:hypothetical protein n=1 Tax=Bradyrhizobium elkanii TaxID=29448 RepID=UPI0004BB2F23|nr:hypothetical protein [Bradyrhizobium elkanii]WLA79603.1 hypothetical protein QNJ99_29930 [Bradyrhizobium elkanii]